MTKRPKLPPITKQIRLLSFDLESNGLHGNVFAVGAVLMDYHGTVQSEFSGRCPIVGKVDDWVAKHVLPAIADMPETHKSTTELRESFWQWYLENEPKADYVVVNKGYPVEYRFLLECQDAKLDERYWQHPFPILDLASLLVMVQKKTSELIDPRASLHHPLHDAQQTAAMAFKAFELAGRIS